VLFCKCQCGYAMCANAEPGEDEALINVVEKANARAELWKKAALLQWEHESDVEYALEVGVIDALEAARAMEEE
jgi:acetone carboxylase gamma subunit